MNGENVLIVLEYNINLLLFKIYFMLCIDVPKVLYCITIRYNFKNKVVIYVEFSLSLWMIFVKRDHVMHITVIKKLYF